jgi:general stress protein 26
MTTPATTLDQRFSDPDSAATSWDETRQAIERAELFWITTVRADGRPHVTPLVAVWLDGALHFCTGAEEQKSLNLAGNPQVILTTGGNQWDAGLDVVVEGEAVQVTDDGVLRELAAAWTAKWDGRWKFAVRDGCFRNGEADQTGVPVYAVRPARVLAFGKGAFSHTSHRF